LLASEFYGRKVQRLGKMGEFAGLSGLRKDCRRTNYDGYAGGRDR
jgi:hypothetical protein